MGRARKLFHTPTPTTQNLEGYPAYERPLEEQYLQTLLTNTFNNVFYATSEDLIQQADDLHKKMIQTDPVFAAKALVFARNHGYMRLAPIYGLFHLSQLQGDRQDLSAEQKIREIFDAAFSGVIQIPSDLSDFLAIVNGQGRGQGGRRIKRAIARFLTEKTSEYWGLKYNGRGRGYSLGDAIATTHPKAKNETQSMLFRYLMGKDVDESVLQEALPQIYAFEKLKKATTDEERVQWIQSGRLPHDVVTAAVPHPSEAVWNAIVKQMPVFALLRHLNTLDRHGVLNDREVRDWVRERLTDKNALAKSKILPFRFATAYHAIRDNEMRDVLRQAVEFTFGNLPEIQGRTAIFLDVSGSMADEYISIGSVFAFALYKKTNGNGLAWAFSDEVYDMRPSLVDSILSQAERIHTIGGTDTYGPIAKLRKDKEHVDNIILITDEQQNMSSPFYRGLKEYRNAINREVKAFVVNVAPYRGALVPETDALTHYIYGWSDQVLQYISLSTRGYHSMVEQVKKMQLQTRSGVFLNH